MADNANNANNNENNNSNIDNYSENDTGVNPVNWFVPNKVNTNLDTINSDAGVAENYKNDKPLPTLLGTNTNENNANENNANENNANENNDNENNNNENNDNENNNNENNDNEKNANENNNNENNNNENNANDNNNENNANDNNDNENINNNNLNEPVAAGDDDDDDDNDDDKDDDENDENDDDDDDDDKDDDDDDNNDDENNNDDDDDDDDDDENENEEPIAEEKTVKNAPAKKINFVSPEALEKILNVNVNVPVSQEEQLMLEDDEDYKKLLNNFNKNDLVLAHKERQFKNFDEIIALSNVVRNKDNQIVDELHQTLPFITKYERTRVLGKRVKQLNNGMLPFIEIKRDFINNYFIAEEELRQKKIPLIIERPLPNGAFEYWKVKDLELL